MNPWEFNDGPDTVCVTSSDVVDGGAPILYASHEVDEDGDVAWQFHSDVNQFDFGKALLVRLDTMVGIDPSLVELCELPIGFFATRSAADAPWGEHTPSE